MGETHHATIEQTGENRLEYVLTPHLHKCFESNRGYNREVRHRKIRDGIIISQYLPSKHNGWDYEVKCTKSSYHGGWQPSRSRWSNNSTTKTHKKHQSSLTIDFKVIPFQVNAIGRDGITDLIKRQNNYLHNTFAISVVDDGDGED